MQPDFMKMAQQAQGKETPQEQEVNMVKEFEEAGLPTGQTPEDAKARVTAILKELGVLDGLRADQLQKMTNLIDEFVKLAMSGDMKALEIHPISKLLNQAQVDFQKAAGAQESAPTNFAGMVPPGGGMSGR